jgi:hypothetical protein
MKHLTLAKKLKDETLNASSHHFIASHAQLCPIPPPFGWLYVLSPATEESPWLLSHILLSH